MTTPGSTGGQGPTDPHHPQAQPGGQPAGATGWGQQAPGAGPQDAPWPSPGQDSSAQGQYGPPPGQYGSPQGQYGPPQGQPGQVQGQYGPPQGQYGPPQGQPGSPPWGQQPGQPPQGEQPWAVPGQPGQQPWNPTGQHGAPAGQPGAPADPAAVKKRRLLTGGAVVVLVAAVIGLLLLVGGGGTAQAGDCVQEESDGQLSVVDCSDDAADYRVAGLVENVTDATISADETLCTDEWPDSVAYAFEGDAGEEGTAFCLEDVG
ncbi:hypothetical protein GB931_01540 [Modestobacter sp. I12A-02628]|uniref:Uncharacterized protein n=1 Tax=Goekera deserti TaxID=2497753 RepID=A0A7K3WKS3_9ACTN|nr:hypothetical protein [Goekera deserti]MPQ96624.1 hypothetical protein [Goekera deserti]NDI47064.1 hypothetical protein [Goekera deserti]NEL56300.1 hypothetical protein [Goekera deserti]